MESTDKQLARATKAIQEAIAELEELAFNGPIAIEKIDVLAIAAKLAGTRKAIQAERTSAKGMNVNVPRETWLQSSVHTGLAAD